MYHITTETRIYNSIDSPEQFRTIRKNWGDNSKVTRAFHWINPHGWVSIDTYDFEVRALAPKE